MEGTLRRGGKSGIAIFVKLLVNSVVRTDVDDVIDIDSNKLVAVFFRVARKNTSIGFVRFPTLCEKVLAKFFYATSGRLALCHKEPV